MEPGDATGDSSCGAVRSAGVTLETQPANRSAARAPFNIDETLILFIGHTLSQSVQPMAGTGTVVQYPAGYLSIWRYRMLNSHPVVFYKDRIESTFVPKVTSFFPVMTHPWIKDEPWLNRNTPLAIDPSITLHAR